MISVLDTTAFSAAMRHEPEIVSFLGGLPPGEFAVVSPVVAEIEFGLRRLDGTSHRYRLLAAQKERLLSAIPLLAWIPAASAQFGAINARLEAAGMMIEDFDIAVAAIARAHGAEVITATLAPCSVSSSSRPVSRFQQLDRRSQVRQQCGEDVFSLHQALRQL